MSAKILQKKIRRFFNLPQKGETYEFRAGLVSKHADERKDTIQRVIAAMTLGKDVSGLFPLVLQNVATHDLQQKKLVYLYLMNYAKSHPELVILATNTFVIDTQDPNPLIRALAIRTMGCIRVESMVDYLAVPLRRTLEDDNPYVRKTAVLCVAKLFDLNAQMCVDHGFLDTLVALVDDPNQMVVANAVSALAEVAKTAQTAPTPPTGSATAFAIDTMVLDKLLSTINECSEWGRVAILKALATYDASNVDAVTHIVEKVSPQLQHENPAVVLNAIKILIRQTPKLADGEAQRVLKRLSAPLCSLMATTPEIQYVALRNIRILLELHPTILDRDLRAFFLHYDDPVYLKVEKIEILVRIVNDQTALVLLSELREYALDVDPEVVSRAIHGLAQLALKVSACAKKSIEILYELFITRGDYVVDDCVVACENILRRYDSAYLSSILSIVTSSAPEVSLETIAGTNAKCSYVWIVGHYPSSMPHLENKLKEMTAGFLEAEASVQTAILNALVKISLSSPTPQTPAILQEVLTLATKEVENADVRDKAFIYWRLLSGSQQTAKDVILAPLPPLESLVESFSPELLRTLKSELGMLGSVYYRPGVSFENTGAGLRNATALRGKGINELSQMAKKEILGNARADTLLDIGDDDSSPDTETPHSQQGSANVLDELNDLFGSLDAPSTDTNHSDLLDLF